MDELFGGRTWSILEGHIISAQDQQQPHTYHKWIEKPLGWEDPISPCSPNTFYAPGVEDLFDELPRMAHFIWMIAWVWETLIGDEIPYFYHHSYLEEAMGQQEGFHSHLPLSHDVHHVVLHTWEKPLEDRFIADYVELCWELLMRRPQEEEGRNFSPPLQLLEDKQHFGGEDCNIPKI